MPRTPLTIFVALSLLLPGAATRAAELTLGAGKIEAAEWQVDGFESVATVSGGRLGLRVRIGRVTVPALGLDLRETTLACAELRLSPGLVDCAAAELDVDLPALGRQMLTARFEHRLETGVTTFDLPAVPLAGGTLGLRGTTGSAGSRLEFEGDALAIDTLLAHARTLGADAAELSASGIVDLRGHATIAADGTLALELAAVLDAASVANDAGTLVGESVSGSLDLAARTTADGWQIDIELAAQSGEAYVEPVYANFAEQPVRLRADGVTTANFVDYDVARFRLEQGELVSLGGSTAFSLPPGDEPLAVHRAELEITDTSVAALYTNLLQVLAAGTLFGDLEASGRVTGRVAVADNAPVGARLAFDAVSLDDRQRRFAVYDLAGEIDWPGPDGEPEDVDASRLHWASGSIGDVLLDGAAVEFRVGGDDVLLLEPLRLPTMGGALVVNRLEMRDYGRDTASGLLDAELEPIQLGQLTGAFGWPAFSGTLSGRLPLLQYDGNAMTVGGTLTARAFDGDIEIANLRVAQPFGRVPRLEGDIRLRNLDLERLTNTFSFGLIQGRLSGDVTGLQLAGWRAQAMELRLYTPPGDRSPHRISQRAVENLASVGGGGAGAALSSGLLKFFEVFAYDRIGLSCVLRDGICAMGGAGPAGDGPLGRGYYIVKGKGVPRIDVVGFRERVSWPALVNQLATITQSEGPVVN